MPREGFRSIVWEVSGGVGRLTLNRPEKRNAIDGTMQRELFDVMSAVRRDRGVHVLIIAGEGGAFCAGGDVSTMLEGDGSAESARQRMMDAHLWMEPLLTLDRPVIAVVDGAAYGAGAALALAADFVLATPRARFCLSFLRLGLVPDCGVFYTLPRVVGLQRAKELVFSTREVGASEARDMGLVLEVLPGEHIAARADELARCFAQASPAALGLAKRALDASLHSDLRTMLEMEANAQGIARSTAHHRAAVERFLAREQPLYRWPEPSEDEARQ